MVVRYAEVQFPKVHEGFPGAVLVAVLLCLFHPGGEHLCGLDILLGVEVICLAQLRRVVVVLHVAGGLGYALGGFPGLFHAGVPLGGVPCTEVLFTHGLGLVGEAFYYFRVVDSLGLAVLFADRCLQEILHGYVEGVGLKVVQGVLCLAEPWEAFVVNAVRVVLGRDHQGCRQKEG